MAPQGTAVSPEAAERSRDPRLESDPIVFEMGETGGKKRGEAVVLVWGAVGQVSRLGLKEEKVASEDPKVSFTLGQVEWEELSQDPDAPVRGRIPVDCSGDGEGNEGREVGGTLEITVTFGDRTWPLQARLVASFNHVLPEWEVLLEEYSRLNPEWEEELRQAVVDAGPSDREKLRALHGFVHRRPEEDGLAALCLSGGGIRSATFNLGVLQGLAKIGLLERFHYLSSVSGGGYIASWLAGWTHRAGGIDDVAPRLQGGQTKIGGEQTGPEATEISHLRQYSNYLTPRLGLFSADTWSLAAIVVRNLLLNLLVLVPLLAAALAIPLLAVSLPTGMPADSWSPGPDLLYWTGVLLAGISLFWMSLLRASAWTSADREEPGTQTERRRRKGKPPFLRLGLLPLLLSAVFILLAIAKYAARYPDRSLHDTPEVVVRCLIWSIAVPILAFVLSVPFQKRVMGRRRSSLRTDLLALLGSGVIEAAIYFGILEGWLPWLLDRPAADYVILGPGLLFGPLLLGKTLFIAFSSVGEGRGYPSDLGDADREWWARWSGWILLSTLAWMGASFLVLYGPRLLQGTVEMISAALAAGGLGGLTSYLGKSSATAAAPGGKESLWRRVAMALAAPLFCLALLLLVSVGTQKILYALPASLSGVTSQPPAPFRGSAEVVLAAIGILFAAGAVMGLFVNVNRFSLQAMYRNRLVRAYLGASHRQRRPNLFTGFDPADNLRMHWLRDNRPLPVVNMALNLVSGQDLAWQQRRAESFTATPFHCGTGRLGYRRSQIYGGEQGISLGTAMATSGAAANPNMGFNSSPAIGFIMALFNARLGIWLGNPGPKGGRAYTRSAPLHSARLALDEAFGWTDSEHPYVNLSDGGHFENLGLYEMVRRRCRTIVVCDAGRDPSCAFDDLGNAIRKIRIDFGISIEFGDGITIFPKSDRAPDNARYCAIGRIRYDAIDEGGAVGTLIYIKPAICGTESYDVYNYARSSADFPHESTADQWFDETQFESYRALGRGTLLAMTGREQVTSFADFAARVLKYLHPTGSLAAVPKLDEDAA